MHDDGRKRAQGSKVRWAWSCVCMRGATEGVQVQCTKGVWLIDIDAYVYMFAQSHASFHGILIISRP